VPGTNERIGRWRRDLQGWIAGMCMALLTPSAVLAQDLQPARVDLPEEAREALKDRWEDWSLASPVAAPCATDGGAAVAPVTAADLDNDGQLDYVTAVQTSEGPRLVAVMFRAWEYAAIELDPLGGDAAAGVLSLEPRGARYTKVNGLDDYFPAVTIVVRRCDGGSVAYIWSGIDFRRTSIGKTGSGAPGK
jgi:hypothetical protein